MIEKGSRQFNLSNCFISNAKPNLHVSVRLSRVDACRDMPKKGARGTADDGAGKSLEEQERTDADVHYVHDRGPSSTSRRYIIGWSRF